MELSLLCGIDIALIIKETGSKDLITYISDSKVNFEGFNLSKDFSITYTNEAVH